MLTVLTCVYAHGLRLCATYLSRDNPLTDKMAVRGVYISAVRTICILMIYVCNVYSTEFVPVFMWESSR